MQHFCRRGVNLALIMIIRRSVPQRLLIISGKYSTAHDASSWNVAYRAYDETFSDKFREYANDALKLSKLPKNARVLDVGSGTGALSLLAAGSEFGLQVTATDYSSEMIFRLRSRAAEELTDDVSLKSIVMDGQNLTFSHFSFDGVFSMFALIFFPDRTRGMREMNRVLRPGGVAVIGSWDCARNVDWIHWSNKALLTVKPNLPRGPPSPALSLSDRNIFREEMLAAGFERVKIECSEKTFLLSNPEHFWIGMSVGFPALAETLAAHFSPEETLLVRDKFVELCMENAAYHGHSPRVKGSCLLGLGFKSS